MGLDCTTGSNAHAGAFKPLDKINGLRYMKIIELGVDISAPASRNWIAAKRGSHEVET